MYNLVYTFVSIFSQMSGTDDVLQGVLISGFIFIGLNLAWYCVRKHRQNITMKKSASTEELSSVNTEDPQT
jgi:hypothetical protein